MTRVLVAFLSFLPEENEHMNNAKTTESKQKKTNKVVPRRARGFRVQDTDRVHDDEEVASEVLIALG